MSEVVIPEDVVTDVTQLLNLHLQRHLKHRAPIDPDVARSILRKAASAITAANLERHLADAEKRGAEKAIAETIMGGQRYAVVWALRRAAEDWRVNATPGDDEDTDAIVARALDARADRIQAGGDR